MKARFPRIDFHRLGFSALFLLTSCSEFFDPTIPQVSAVTPAHESTLASTNTVVTVAFTEPMDHVRTEKAFTLSVGGARVDSDFRWVENDLSCIPRTPLKAGFRYSVEVLADAVNARGMRLKYRHQSWFEVGSPGLYPTVLLTSPATAVITNFRPEITLVFSRPMDRKKTEQAFTLSPDPGGHFSWPDDKTLKYLLHADFSWLSEITVRLSKSACDQGGYGLEEDFRSSFTCGNPSSAPEFRGVYALGDVRLPISTRYFSLDQSGVSRYLGLVFHFSKAIDRPSFESGLSVSPSIDGRFEATNDSEGHKILFYPTAPLVAAKTYRLTLSGTIKDADGQTLGQNQTLAFTTDNSDSIPPSVASLSSGGLSPWVADQVNGWAGTVSGMDLTLRWNTAEGVGMDIASVQQGASLSRFAGVGGYGAEGTILGWIWDGERKTVTLSLTNLALSNYYRLRLASGQSGCRDGRTNAMQSDSVWLFYRE